MNKPHYLSNGFKVVGTLSKDSTNTKKKNSVYVDWVEGFDPTDKMGVYILFENETILKIGESQNLKHRFQCYESHSGPTNQMVRESMNDNQSYGIMFIECPSYEVGFAGVKVPSGINYRFLEKALLSQYVEKESQLPKLNKGIQ